jgi:crotonobetainyl-CoA:carnitine CoA-transferase CaiB-like acyl-CoA transferase
MPAWLHGWRIVDASLLLPGPFATLRLAQMGAEVVKVEPPAGDGAARLGVSTEDQEAVSRFYRALNQNKVVLRLDLKTDAGQAAFLEAIANADALVEGFRPGTWERLGLPFERLWTVNRQLVIVSITGYASDGPLAPYAGHDLNYLAWSGLLAQSDGKPCWLNVQVADLLGGALHAALAVVAAVHHARTTGVGSRVEVPMCETLVASAPFAHAEAELPENERGLLLGAVPCYAVYRCADDRYLAVAALEAKFWTRFCTALGMPQWQKRQFDRSGATHRAVAKRLRTRPQAEWVAQLVPLDCCVAPVLSITEARERFQGEFDPATAFPAFPLRCAAPASSCGELPHS